MAATDEEVIESLKDQIKRLAGQLGVWQDKQAKTALHSQIQAELISSLRCLRVAEDPAVASELASLIAHIEAELGLRPVTDADAVALAGRWSQSVARVNERLGHG